MKIVLLLSLSLACGCLSEQFHPPTYLNGWENTNRVALPTGTIIDVNGDGLPDWVEAYDDDGSRLQTWLNTGSTWVVESEWRGINETSSFALRERSIAREREHDRQHWEKLAQAIVSLVSTITEQNNRPEKLSQSSAVVKCPMARADRYILPHIHQATTTPPKLTCDFHDLNGDGLVDYVCSSAGQSFNCAYINTGSGFQLEETDAAQSASKALDKIRFKVVFGEDTHAVSFLRSKTHFSHIKQLLMALAGEEKGHPLMKTVDGDYVPLSSLEHGGAYVLSIAVTAN